ncbi:MAG: thiamine pyrophosphate-binding protein [Rhodobacteraceae bacterium]|nr:thiamine pyrophosphate-binding protein [Paracoccaceae bacterium]
MKLTVAELFARMLIANGFDNLYCLPGVQNDHFFDALHDHTDRLAPIHTRHEQGAAYMAMGAAMATGKPQAYCVVPGPGFLNSTAALCTALAVGAPVLAIVGEIHSNALGKSFGALHELPDQFAILQQLTAGTRRIVDGKSAAEVISATLQDLVSGKPGPVGIEIPYDKWTAQVPGLPDNLQVSPIPGPQPDPHALSEAADLLSRADRPMLVVGGGAQDHGDAIRALAERLSAAVLTFRHGQGVVPHDHPLRVNLPEAHALWPQVDVAAGLGSRLSTPLKWGVDDGLKLIHIDVNRLEMGRVCEPDVGVHADLADALPLLLDSIDSRPAASRHWREAIANVRKRFSEIYARKLRLQQLYLEAIAAELPPEGIFVEEITQIGYASRLLYPASRPRTFISSGFQGTLGFGLPTALGVAHARRDVPVVAVSGDGGALFAIGELATATLHSIPLNLVVFTDNSFGNVRRVQERLFDGRTIASNLDNPDFVKLAESFGVPGLRATSPDELRLRLRECLAIDGPAVIEVPVGEFPSPWGFLLLPQNRGTKSPPHQAFF